MSNNKDVVRLHGRFVFSAHREFNDAFERAVLADSQVITIDLSDVDYLDSAALGMLLVARNRAEACGKSLVLRGATGTVLQVLEIAKFTKLFHFA